MIKDILVIFVLFICSLNGQNLDTNKIFPQFNTIDVFRKPISSSDLLGKKIYVQFVNPKQTDQIDLLIDAYNKSKHNKMAFLVITNDFKIFIKKVHNIPNNMIVIDKDYKYIKSLFHGSACCEELYVYDINGKQTFFGTINLINIENIKINLSRILEDGQIPFTPNFVYEGENINDINWLEQIKPIINKEKAKYYVASFHLPDFTLKNVHYKSNNRKP